MDKPAQNMAHIVGRLLPIALLSNISGFNSYMLLEDKTQPRVFMKHYFMSVMYFQC